MTKEEYIDTNEYEYDVDKGIWSNYWQKFLEGNVNKHGYVVVTLKCIDGKQRLFRYHRALWYLAYGEIPENYQINHINENKTDNRLCNLELVTPKQNCNHATRNERMATKLSKPVEALDEEGNVIYRFNSVMEAERQGFCHVAVCKCCNNCYNRQGNNIYKRLIWRYAV